MNKFREQVGLRGLVREILGEHPDSTTVIWDRYTNVSSDRIRAIMEATPTEALVNMEESPESEVVGHLCDVLSDPVWDIQVFGGEEVDEVWCVRSIGVDVSDAELVSECLRGDQVESLVWWIEDVRAP